MVTKPNAYPATLEIDYPKKLDRLSTFFRFILAIPILVIVTVLSSTTTNQYVNEAGEQMSNSGGGIIGGLFIATLLMILFQQRYPRWWFDFNLELNRLSTRVSAYLLFLTDKYPSTVEAQTVHLEVAYPDVKEDLNRWLPLVKWLLAFPHYVVLLFLVIAVMFVTIFAWFAILFTGKYPKNLFDFVVGVHRWDLRVNAYALLLTTDQYPPFSLK
ncbi:MAG: DUF4389 domain-containing protein [Candidatus Saccharimonadaceae bacterium]